MRVLYAIQGTGNGHLSRARDIIPILQEFCEIDILVSGIQADVELGFPVKYRRQGLSFIFGKHGGVDVWNTYVKMNLPRLKEEIDTLPVEDYDFVINDFEPVSAWACYLRKVPCLALSHQSALLGKGIPKPKKSDPLGKFILKNYAPATLKMGIHFKNYNENTFLPVIRQEVRDQDVEDLGHYTVYLPAYDERKLIKKLKRFEKYQWQVFSKHTRSVIEEGNVLVRPISNEDFIRSMATSTGILCGAGFETPAEALCLGKKLMVIPMKGQYEQQCNAAALKEMGVPIMKNLKEKHMPKLGNWLRSDSRVNVFYPDTTRKMVHRIFEKHVQDVLQANTWERKYRFIYEMPGKIVTEMEHIS